MAAVEYGAAWPLSGEKLVVEAGTFWSQFFSQQDELRGFYEVLAWQEYQAYLEQSQARSRYSLIRSGDRISRSFYRAKVRVRKTYDNKFAFTLPEGMQFAQEIRIPPAYQQEYGRDYEIVGSRLVSESRLPLGETEATFYNTQWVSGDLSRFWTDIARIRDDSDDAEDLVRAFMRCIENQGSAISFRGLIAEVFGCPISTASQTVVSIDRQDDYPIVVATEETLVGPQGSSAIVSVGDQLGSNQDVFDAVQFWDANNAIPSWVTSLKIPARYFATEVNGQLEFDNSDEATVLSAGPSAQIPQLMTFPITGDTADIDAFFAFVRARELELEEPVYAFLVGDESQRLSQAPAEVNPLEMIRRLWLQFGATVSVIRLEPTLNLLNRAQLLRRVTPPWLTHIVHFEDPVPDALLPLC